MKIHDRLIGGLSVAGGVALIVAASQLRAMPGQLFGSAFFPTVLGVACCIVGLLLMLKRQQAADLDPQPWLSLPDWFLDRRAIRAGAFCVAAVAFILFAESIGFMLSAFVLLLALMLMMGAGVTMATASSIGATVVLHLVFVVLLRVPLPFGVIERMLS
ncbi:MAG: tripartite tricarboxylate transporter TctB family protein [Burkholderiaceae bacterium]